MTLNKLLIFFLIYCPLSLLADGRSSLEKMFLYTQHLENQELLIPMIQKRRAEISTIKQHWKGKILQLENHPFLSEVNLLLIHGDLQRLPSGSGGVYLLCTPGGVPAFVLKPFDEDMLCLHNPKSYASPYHNEIFRVRNSIPLYRSMQAEALAYSFAQVLHFTHLTPETHLGVFTHPSFFDISDLFIEETSPLGSPIREKLCSVQRYVPHIGNLAKLVHKWIQNGGTESQICEEINGEEFEKLFLFLCLLYDTDAHAGNIYTIEDHLEKLTLVKFDSGLAFPEKNENFLNALIFFPQAKLPPSRQLCTLIQKLPIATLIEKMIFFEMEDCMDSFLERVSVLQEHTCDTPKTWREIGLELQALELPCQ